MHKQQQVVDTLEVTDDDGVAGAHSVGLRVYACAARE